MSDAAWVGLSVMVGLFLTVAAIGYLTDRDARRSKETVRIIGLFCGAILGLLSGVALFALLVSVGAYDGGYYGAIGVAFQHLILLTVLGTAIGAWAGYFAGVDIAERREKSRHDADKSPDPRLPK